jgi:arylsulfatase A-like enzyme
MALGSLALGPSLSAGPPEKPNFLVIVSDDARYDTMDYMPRTKARIFDEGLTFTNAFCTTPLCGPSRATILTGMYAHNHGVLDNWFPLNETTFIERLHDVGYHTGLVGKGVNSWRDQPRPEFDFWAVPTTRTYFDPIVNFDGDLIEHEGYRTHIMRDYALQFLDAAMQQPEPFVLLFWPFAPHRPADPAPGDEDLYPDLPPHRPPNHNEEDVSDKPLWLRNKPLLTEDEIENIDTLRRKQLQCLNSLDEAIESLILALEVGGTLDNTMVAYQSDNGLFWGEHRLTRKKYVYQPSPRIPFGLRFPPLVSAPRVEDRLVGNLDIAPTIYQLARIHLPFEVNGRSLVPLMRGTDRWRTDLLVEHWPWDTSPYAAFVGRRLVYVETEDDLSELYDLRTDPYQLQNQIDNPAYALVIAKLAARLEQLRQA